MLGYEVKHEIIDRYLIDRDLLLDSIGKHLLGDKVESERRGIAKKLPLIISYGGSWNTWIKTFNITESVDKEFNRHVRETFRGMSREMLEIIKVFKEDKRNLIFSDCVRAVEFKRKRKTEWNDMYVDPDEGVVDSKLLYSAMALFLQDMEGTVFHHLVNGLVDKCHVVSYVNDSLILRGNLEWNEIRLSGGVGLDIPLCVKKLVPLRSDEDWFERCLVPDPEFRENLYKPKPNHKKYLDIILKSFRGEVWKNEEYLILITDVCYSNFYPRDHWIKYINKHNRGLCYGSRNVLWDGYHKVKDVSDLGKISRETDEETYVKMIIPTIQKFKMDMVSKLVISLDFCKEKYECMARYTNSRYISDTFADVKPGHPDFCKSKLFTKLYKILAIISGTGTGKSSLAFEYIKVRLMENPQYRVLLLSSYIGYADAICTQAKTQAGIDFINYDNIRHKIKDNPNLLVLSLESIHKLPANAKYDLVVIDESDTILDKYSNGTPTIRKDSYNECVRRIQDICIDSDRVWFMDAFMSERTINFIEDIRNHRLDGDSYELVFNTYLKYNKTYLYGVNLIADHGREAEKCIEKWKNTLLRTIKNHRVFVVFSNADKARYYADIISENYPSKVVRVYTKNSTDITKKELKQLEQNWLEADIVIMSPIAPVGINFDPIDAHFDCTFAYIDNHGPHILIMLQLMDRTRKTKSSVNHVLQLRARADDVSKYKNTIRSAERVRYDEYDEKYYEEVREMYVCQRRLVPKSEVMWLTKNNEVSPYLDAVARLNPVEAYQYVRPNTLIIDGMSKAIIREGNNPEEGVVLDFDIDGEEDVFVDVKPAVREWMAEEVPVLSNKEMAEMNYSEALTNYSSIQRQQVWEKFQMLKAFLTTKRKPSKDKELKGYMVKIAVSTMGLKGTSGYRSLSVDVKKMIEVWILRYEHEASKVPDQLVTDKMLQLYDDYYMCPLDSLEGKKRNGKARHVWDVNVPFIAMYLREDPVEYMRKIKSIVTRDGERITITGQRKTEREVLLLNQLIKLNSLNGGNKLVTRFVCKPEDFLNITINNKNIHEMINENPERYPYTSEKGKGKNKIIEENITYCNKLLFHTIGGYFQRIKSNNIIKGYEYVPEFEELERFVRPADYHIENHENSIHYEQLLLAGVLKESEKEPEQINNPKILKGVYAMRYCIECMDCKSQEDKDKLIDRLYDEMLVKDKEEKESNIQIMKDEIEERSRRFEENKNNRLRNEYRVRYVLDVGKCSTQEEKDTLYTSLFEKMVNAGVEPLEINLEKIELGTTNGDQTNTYLQNKHQIKLKEDKVKLKRLDTVFGKFITESIQKITFDLIFNPDDI